MRGRSVARAPAHMQCGFSRRMPFLSIVNGGEQLGLELEGALAGLLLGARGAALADAGGGASGAPALLAASGAELALAAADDGGSMGSAEPEGVGVDATALGADEAAPEPDADSAAIDVDPSVGVVACDAPCERARNSPAAPTTATSATAAAAASRPRAGRTPTGSGAGRSGTVEGGGWVAGLPTESVDTCEATSARPIAARSTEAQGAGRAPSAACAGTGPAAQPSPSAAFTRAIVGACSSIKSGREAVVETVASSLTTWSRPVAGTSAAAPSVATFASCEPPSMVGASSKVGSTIVGSFNPSMVPPLTPSRRSPGTP